MLLWPVEREPEYKGKKLIVWIGLCRKGFYSRGPERAETRDAVEAVRQIGTNAIPFLVRWMDYDPPAWKLALVAAKRRLPEPFGQSEFIERWIVHKGQVDDAMVGFSILGPDASGAVPELARLMASRLLWKGPDAASGDLSGSQWSPERHSITWSARRSIDGGNVRPRALAVLRFSVR